MGPGRPAVIAVLLVVAVFVAIVAAWTVCLFADLRNLQPIPRDMREYLEHNPRGDR
jgi:hypothetical protein